MPLLDHFRPPLAGRRHWESFPARWASDIAGSLNQDWLPPLFFAEPQVHAGGQAQVDVGTWKDGQPAPASPGAGAPVAAPARVWTAPPAVWTMPAVFPDTFEVHIINSEAGPTLVAAIELVSPGNKDRPETRRAFAAKCVNYLCQGISLITIDIVTSRLANLHNETMRLMGADNAFLLSENALLYGVAYRPIRRSRGDEIDVWPTTLALGAPLPTLTLALTADLSVPVDFETTYQEACQGLRLA